MTWLRRWLRSRLMGAAGKLFLPLLAQAFKRDHHDIVACRQVEALRETAEFVGEHMAAVRYFSEPLDLLIHAAALADQRGLFCEFGVFNGRTINSLARALPHVTIHGFDSFQGLPEFWRPEYPPDLFLVKKLPKVRPNVQLVRGWFHESLPRFLAERSEPVSFLHFDCDLYSSTKTVLDALEPRIGPGAVLVFDEYFNYPGWQLHEHRAFTEFIDSSRLAFEYLGYCRYGQQVAMRLIAREPVSRAEAKPQAACERAAGSSLPVG